MVFYQTANEMNILDFFNEYCPTFLSAKNRLVIKGKVPDLNIKMHIKVIQDPYFGENLGILSACWEKIQQNVS